MDGSRDECSFRRLSPVSVLGPEEDEQRAERRDEGDPERSQGPRADHPRSIREGHQGAQPRQRSSRLLVLRSDHVSRERTEEALRNIGASEGADTRDEDQREDQRTGQGIKKNHHNNRAFRYTGERFFI